MLPLSQTSPERPSNLKWKFFPLVIISLISGFYIGNRYRAFDLEVNPGGSSLGGEKHGELLSCFRESSDIKSVDISTWENFSVLGFNGRKPPEFAINRIGALQYEIKSNVASGVSIEIDAKRLNYNIHGFSDLGGYSVLYEPLSKIWWSSYIGQPSWKRCNPNPIAVSNKGVPIYLWTDGDAGVGVTKYFVILEPTQDQIKSYDGYQPVLITLTIVTDQESSGDIEGLEKILGNIIKTLEAGPVHQG